LFDEDAVAMNRKRMMKAKGVLASKLNKSGSSADLAKRRYTCRSLDDREDILIDIFSAGFALECRAAATRAQPEYRVVKYNPQQKPQERVFKFTCDSLMNLDPTSRKIKSEIPFAGISSVSLDADRPNDVMWLHFKAEDSARKIICKDFAATLCQALQDCVKRYQTSEDFDEEDERALMAAATTVTEEESVPVVASHQQFPVALPAGTSAQTYPQQPQQHQTAVYAQPVAAGQQGQQQQPVSASGYQAIPGQLAPTQVPSGSMQQPAQSAVAQTQPQPVQSLSQSGGGWARVSPSRRPGT
jgi:hypothetical protein